MVNFEIHVDLTNVDLWKIVLFQILIWWKYVELWNNMLRFEIEKN